MAKTKAKYTEAQQEEIDKGWALFNAAMEACEEAEGFINDLGEDLDIDTSRTCEALGDAHTELEKVYSYGAPILPTHSSDKK